jgi:flagellar biogenesis protein FliO
MTVSLWIRIIVASVLVGAAWLAVRVRARRQGGGPSRPVEVLARLGLSKGISVAVVRVGGRGLVLGLSEKGVSVVAELGEEDLASVMAAKDPSAEPLLAPLPARVLGAGDPAAAEPQAAHIVEQTRTSSPAAPPIDLRNITHRPVGPRMGPMQRLRRMTLRTSVTATGRPAAQRLTRGPVRHDARR